MLNSHPMELHRDFLRHGQRKPAVELVERHGPLLRAWLQFTEPTASDLKFCNVIGQFLGTPYRGVGELWLPLLLARGHASSPTERNRCALWLAAQTGWTPEQLGAALAIQADEAAAALQSAVLEATQAGENPEKDPTQLGPLHPSRSQLAGAATRSLGPAGASEAALHLTWCTPCRDEVGRLATAAQAASADLPALDPQLIQKAVDSAVTAREENAMGPRISRFLGLRPGAKWRALRLAAIAAGLLLCLASAITQVRHRWIEDEQPGPMLRVQLGPTLRVGEPVAIAVAALDGAGVPYTAATRTAVQLAVLDDHGRTLATRAVALEADGTAHTTLTVASLDQRQRSGYLQATAILAGHERRAQVDVTVEQVIRQHLSPDKPTYQPGQTVHLRGLTFEGGSGKPLAGKAARLELRDPKGTRVARSDVTVSPMGVSSADIELAGGAALGTWHAVLKVGETETSVPITVERYSLPPFSVKVTPSVKSMTDLVDFDVDVAANLMTGTPLTAGKASLTARLGGQTLAYDVKPLGAAPVRFHVTMPKGKDNNLRSYGHFFEQVQLEVVVRDPAGRAESGAGTVKVVRDQMRVTVASQAPSVRRDLPRPNKILVRAVRVDDSPVQTQVALFAPGDGEQETVGAGEKLGEGTTGPDGIAALDLPPAFFGRPLAVLAKDPKDGRTYWTRLEPPQLREGNLPLACDKALIRAGDTLTCEVFAPLAARPQVRAELDGRTVAMVATPAKPGIAQVAIQIPDEVVGLVLIAVDGAPEDDVLKVLVAPKDGLRVALRGLEAKKPGEEAQVLLKVSDSAGKPKAAAVGLAVVDAAVFARVAGETPDKVIAALFAQSELAEAAMALLFPEAEPGTPGGQGQWTPAQQAAARWFLAGQSGSAGPMHDASSQQSDLDRLRNVQVDARILADNTLHWTLLVWSALLALALLVASFWLRNTAGAALIALAIGGMAKWLMSEVVDIDRRTADPVVLLLAIAAFGMVLWLVVRERRKVTQAAASPRLLRGLQSAMWATLAVLFVLSLWGVRGSLGGAKVAMAPARDEAATATVEMRVEERERDDRGDDHFRAKAEEPMAAAAPKPASAPAGMAADGDSMARNRAQIERKTIAGAFKDGGTKLFADDEGEAVAKTFGKGGGGGGGEEAPVAIRKDFPETLYFNPAAITAEDGTGSVQFHVADSITAWQIYALASDAAGSLGHGSGELVVTKPFHLDLDVPHDLTVGDEVAVQVAVQNETSQKGEAQLTAKSDTGLVVDATLLQQPIAVGPQGIAGLQLPLKASAAGVQNVTVAGSLAGDKDALQKPIEVAPDGKQFLQTFAGTVTSEVRRTVAIPDLALAEGRSVQLTVLGSPLAAALDSLEQMAQEPHGCFEQQASTLLVDALVLQQLRAAGVGKGERQDRLVRTLALGYQELLGYEVSGGGFGYFGADRRTELTAWGLVLLSELRKVIYVDDELLERTQRALLDAKHSDDTFGSPAETAYAAMALVAADPDCTLPLDPTATQAAKNLRETCGKVLHRVDQMFAAPAGLDPYALALAADALLGAGPVYQKRGEALLDELDHRGALVGEGRDRRVSFQPKGGTLFASYGLGAELETTALVTHALIVYGGRPDKAREALRAVLALRSDDGGFYSTQGAALAVRALLVASAAAKNTGKLAVQVDGKQVREIAWDPTTLAAPQLLELAPQLHAGSEVKLLLQGGNALAGDVGYRIRVQYYLPWTAPVGPPLAVTDEVTPRLRLSQGMDRAVYNLGDKATQQVTVWRDGTAGQRGMLLVQVGLPPGFQLAQGAIDSLQRGGVKRVEPYARGLAIYMEDPYRWGPTTISLPLTAARAVKKVQVPRSRVYFYYQPQIEAIAPPVPVLVKATLATAPR